MLRRIVAFLSVLLLLVGGASAGDEPKFDQFPAGKVYKGSAQCLLEIEKQDLYFRSVYGGLQN